MKHQIISKIIVLTSPSLKPTSTHTPTPVPPPVNPAHTVVISDNGLTTALLIIVTLALIGVIVWMLWMLRTKRWVSARSLTIKAARVDSSQNWGQGTNVPDDSRSAYQPSPPLPQGSYKTQQNPARVERSGENIVSGRESLSAQAQPEDPLKNKRWLGLAEECVGLYDELDGLFPPSDARQETAAHVMRRLQDMLARSGVEPISHDRAYDIHRHLVVPPNLAVTPGTPIARIVSPGFAVRRRVLRPAQVQVVSTGGENIERESENE